MTVDPVQLSYTQALDALLGYVGKQVQIQVGGVDELPLFVAAIKGVLRQGSKDHLAEFLAGRDKISYFAIADEHGFGIYVTQDAFRGAWQEQPTTLIIDQGSIRLRIFE
jgi:hypothetical protein